SGRHGRPPRRTPGGPPRASASAARSCASAKRNARPPPLLPEPRTGPRRGRDHARSRRAGDPARNKSWSVDDPRDPKRGLSERLALSALRGALQRERRGPALAAAVTGAPIASTPSRHGAERP